MSATNSTTNYSLPLFIPTDKPAWLVDWNGAMSAIDTAIKQAQTAADIAGTDIGTLQGDIVSINAALTSVNNAVSQLRLDTNANTGAINTIQELLGNGTPTTTDKTVIGAINEINAEMPDLDLDAYTGSFSVTSTGTVEAAYTNVRYMLNAAKSIGKIYGSINVSGVSLAANAWTVIATLTASDIDPISEDYYINLGYSNIITSNNVFAVRPSRLHFKTNGTIDIEMAAEGASTDTSDMISLPPCIYFLKDMGD